MFIISDLSRDWTNRHRQWKAGRGQTAVLDRGISGGAKAFAAQYDGGVNVLLAVAAP
jgi:hypothetical protein